jgi:predicted GH43/DUF377 family glycosyl hydrolase
MLTRQDVQSDSPELHDVSSVFNPGAVIINGKTHLLLRVQNRGRETFLLQAKSSDGIDFHIYPNPTSVTGLEVLNQRIYHIYDPRITYIEDRLLVSLAIDIDNGCRAILTEGDDLSHLEYVGQMWNGDARNGVLFPEKIGGRYIGLVRPNVPPHGLQPTSGSEIWLIESSDLREWHPIKPILKGRPHYWDELIGSGPPPVKTREGWLHIYHGIATHFESVNIYQAGVCLLDLEDPSVIKARGRYNILEPREEYELLGQVPNVVFPTGMIVDDFDSDGFAPPDSRVTIYYGAADTVVAAATATVEELLEHCHAGSENEHSG